MTAMPRVLLVGNDLISLRTWKMILDIQFKVSLSARLCEAVRTVESERFDVIVICGDLDNWKQIAELASRKNALMKIIAVIVMEDEHPAWVDAAICSALGPYALLKLCAGLFNLASTMRAHGFSLGGTGTYIPKRPKVV